MSHSKNYKPNEGTGLNWRLGDSVAILGTIVNIEKTFTGQIMVKIDCGGEVVLMHEKLVTLLGRKEENPA